MLKKSWTIVLEIILILPFCKNWRISIFLKYWLCTILVKSMYDNSYYGAKCNGNNSLSRTQVSNFDWFKDNRNEMKIIWKLVIQRHRLWTFKWIFKVAANLGQGLKWSWSCKMLSSWKCRIIYIWIYILRDHNIPSHKSTFYYYFFNF